MKVIHLNTNDIQGGAAQASYRLHTGLRGIGIDSQMLVQRKISDVPTIIAPATKIEKAVSQTRPSLDLLPVLLYSNRQRTPYSIQWLPDRLVSRVAQISPDIINLHWINAGFLQIETLAKFKQPLVWTAHDMWPFTGGCHYSGECNKYTQSCGHCPQLKSQQDGDISRWVWWRKAQAWKNLNLTIVTPSQWLADCARNSSLFQDLRIEVIANGLDIQKYKPIEKNTARHLLGLPQDKQLILFGAMSPTSDNRKGFHLLRPALKKLSQSPILQEKLELVIFGASEPKEPIDVGFKIHYLGRLNDDISLAITYSAADVMIVPSIQEAFGQTASESLSCGTPVVAFNATGLKDIVEHQQNGYLAKPFEVEDLARGINWVLEDTERYNQLCIRARQKVEQEFTLEIQASKYLKLYNEMLASFK
ncbi:MAG: glycosyltransferase family 4 protein [Microcystis sp. M54BS1]|uniref:glycosyltransferase family 4 protein n=1 Tax=unclassified Microcystis TaxID=2643300 RepID=UPI00257ABC11|nr:MULTISPECIES: glycosyltransferase family 4 protein [unclassified Microcystis]MCA2538082.1 glycosyltransferase family 4 protein [Microcystis sp. M54BS1]MCA2598231.1 glycosyltransferase family 4 protein [Microcystis sp. M38BS1]MCA2612774.1 glycosyltransferase family 4 protein [Microcystis sp. M27BS1]MCA2504061.1 glycosyltransferase family 4 protein [Microcystis sp. M62BS1]MCA2510165.1 glycosyltransferase family 4 protein [Microcystis sp. M60BS1]